MKTFEVWYSFPDEYVVDTVQATDKKHAIEVSLANNSNSSIKNRISCVEEVK